MFWFANGGQLLGEWRFVAVTTHRLPEPMRDRAFEIAQASSGWVGK